mgnify:CR=1 FL=1
MIDSVDLDLHNVWDLDMLHKKLKYIFGFPDFYGNNYSALVDCLSSLRYPEDGMTSIVIDKDCSLDIFVKGLFSSSLEVAQTLISAVEDVNKRAALNNLPPSLKIVPI